MYSSAWDRGHRLRDDPAFLLLGHQEVPREAQRRIRGQRKGADEVDEGELVEGRVHNRIVVPEASDRGELQYPFGMMDQFPKQLPINPIHGLHSEGMLC